MSTSSLIGKSRIRLRRKSTDPIASPAPVVQPSLSGTASSAQTSTLPSSGRSCSGRTSSCREDFAKSYVTTRAIPALEFHISNATWTTCQSIQIDWEATHAGSGSGTRTSMNLLLNSTRTNFLDDQSGLVTSKILAQGLEIDKSRFTWNFVNVPGGTYNLVACVDLSGGLLQQFSSGPLTVINGTDLSCLPTFAVESTSNTSSISRGGLNGGQIAAFCIAAAALVASVLGIYLLISGRIKRKRSPTVQKSVEFKPDIKSPPSRHRSVNETPIAKLHNMTKRAPNAQSLAQSSTSIISTCSTSPAGSPPPRQSSLPKLLIPVRRDPKAKADVLPPLPESPGLSDPIVRALHPSVPQAHLSAYDCAAPSSQTFQPVRRPDPLILSTDAENCRPESFDKELPPEPSPTLSPQTASTNSGGGATLSRAATNTTISSLIPSMFRRSLPHPPMIYSAAKPESVFGTDMGNAKEGFDGRSSKSRPNSFYPSPANPSPLPPSAWSSTPLPTPTGIARSSPIQSFRSSTTGKQSVKTCVPSFTPVELQVDQNTFIFPTNIPPPPPLPPPPSQASRASTSHSPVTELP